MLHWLADESPMYKGTLVQNEEFDTGMAGQNEESEYYSWQLSVTREFGHKILLAQWRKANIRMVTGCTKRESDQFTNYLFGYLIVCVWWESKDYSSAYGINEIEASIQ